VKQSIAWQKSNSPYATRDVWLGEGSGYAWFTRGTLFGQDMVRESLKLDGGDDRIQLAVDGLQIEDPGSMTANSCLHIAARFGDQIIPHLEQVLHNPQLDVDPWRVIGCLTFVQTDRSTQTLMKLYDSEESGFRRAAEYALIHRPFRKEAKSAYFDMLTRHSSIESAASVCVEFQWQDALPLLENLTSRPPTLRSLSTTLPARRTLEGRPIAPQLLDADKTLRGLIGRPRSVEFEAQANAAHRLLVQTDDAEAANWIAMSLATMTTKGDVAPVNNAGIAILRARPRESTEAFLQSLKASVQESDRQTVTKLIGQVTGRPQR
jgi:hypothetical protein